ncbi:hypothetical protein JOM56_004432 [Amanita muscaria]
MNESSLLSLFTTRTRRVAATFFVCTLLNNTYATCAFSLLVSAYSTYTENLTRVIPQVPSLIGSCSMQKSAAQGTFTPLAASSRNPGSSALRRAYQCSFRQQFWMIKVFPLLNFPEFFHDRNCISSYSQPRWPVE